MHTVLNELSRKELYMHILASLQNIITGFTISFVFALLMAFLLYEIKIMGKIVYPIIEILRPIPNAGWVPISILVCSTIDQSIILITFIGAFFPIFLTIYRALKDFNAGYLNIAKIYKLNKKDEILKILLPGIAPNIATASMLGISGAWLSVIMAEMISGKIGIGYYTWKNYTLLNYELVFLGMIIMGLLGASFSLIFSIIGKKTSFWVKRG